MKHLNLITPGIVFSIWILLLSCNGSDSSAKDAIQTDPTSIALGHTLFDQKCSGCHNFSQDAIGPDLAGVTTRAPADWIRHFIKDPNVLIKSGDPRAHELLKKYTTLMPSFASFSPSELNGILAYLHTHKTTVKKAAKKDPNALENPIPEPIRSSGMVVDLQLLTQVPSSSKKLPFTRIAKLDATADGVAVFVSDQRGFLYKLVDNKPVLYLDISKWKPHFINEPGLATGLGSFAFHPDFSRNGLFYTTHTEAPNSTKADFAYADSIKVTLQWVLTEWHTTNPAAMPFTGTNRELLRINMVSGIHGVQEISFDPNAKKGTADYGLLYIGVGDGGSVENGYPFLPHRTDHVWGTILRIDPQGRNSANKQYGIPSQNPFSKRSDSNTLREIYAYGFRNPNRMTWSRSGQMLATNIGQANIEALNLILKGHDYGWPLREGSFALHTTNDINFVYPLPSNDTAWHITYPVAQYDHDEGKAISGGFEYTGTAIPELRGKYLFGDVPTGRLFYVDVNDLKLRKQATIKEWNVALDGKTIKLKDVCGSDRVDLHFARDKKGEMYILTKPDGKIYKLARATNSK